MELIINIIKFRKHYEDEYNFGVRIKSVNAIGSNGRIIPEKYFSLENNRITPFNYHDMFEILYIDMNIFEVGDNSWE